MPRRTPTAFGRSPMAFLDSHHYGVESGLYPALERQAARLGSDDRSDRRAGDQCAASGAAISAQ
jgi:hypothetical protein